MNAEHGKWTVKSSFSATVPSLDCGKDHNTYICVVAICLPPPPPPPPPTTTTTHTHIRDTCTVARVTTKPHARPHLDHIGNRSSQFLRHQKTLDIEYELTLIGCSYGDRDKHIHNSMWARGGGGGGGGGRTAITNLQEAGKAPLYHREENSPSAGRRQKR